MSKKTKVFTKKRGVMMAKYGVQTEAADSNGMIPAKTQFDSEECYQLTSHFMNCYVPGLLRSGHKQSEMPNPSDIYFVPIRDSENKIQSDKLSFVVGGSTIGILSQKSIDEYDFIFCIDNHLLSSQILPQDSDDNNESVTARVFRKLSTWANEEASND